MFKLRKLIILGLIAFAALSTQCSKKETIEPTLSPSLPEKGNYYPTSMGSSYIYKIGSTEMGLYDQYDTIKFTIKETFEDNNKSYTRVNGTPIRVENGNYYVWTTSELFIGEHIFLKDNLPKGSTWGHTEGFQDAEKFNYSIKDIHPKKEVDGKTYGNVIEVLEEIYWKNTDGSYALLTSTNYFYAKNIGLINWYENYNANSPKLNKVKLANHHII